MLAASCSVFFSASIRSNAEAKGSLNCNRLYSAKDGTRKWRPCVDRIPPEPWVHPDIPRWSNRPRLQQFISIHSPRSSVAKSSASERNTHTRMSPTYFGYLWILDLDRSWINMDKPHQMFNRSNSYHDSSLFPRMAVFERKWPSPRRVPPAKQLGPLGALSKAQDRSRQIWCWRSDLDLLMY